MYGSECWALDEKKEIKIYIVGTRMLDDSVRGVTGSDRIRNEYNKREFTTWLEKLDCTDSALRHVEKRNNEEMVDDIRVEENGVMAFALNMKWMEAHGKKYESLR